MIRGLVVSCQPVPGGPFDTVPSVLAFARAAAASGARGLRIEGAANVAAVVGALDLPVIGLIKRDFDAYDVRITALLEDVAALCDAGAGIIAFDATRRTRPVPCADLVAAIHARGRLAMADCADLADAALNAGLIGHLKSDDFFAVNEYPTAEFKTTAVTPIAACTNGTTTHQVEGQFTLRGKTHPLTFPALVAKGPDGSLTLQAEFDFDRTLWGAVYGSGKFFAKLAQHVVNDLVHLHIKLRFEPCN
jgi:hypothetical protein